MNKFCTLLIFFTLTSSLSVVARDAAPLSCGNQGLQSARGTEVQMGILGLPKMLFVARSAEFVVATIKDKKPVRIRTKHSFTTAKAEVLCADVGFPEAHYSLYAPTLINFAANKNQPHSIWQFQLMANKKQIGIWNTRSRLQSIHQDLAAVESQAGVQLQVYQTDHDRYELVLQRQVGESKEILTIQYDAF
jgi:hypothetical protein